MRPCPQVEAATDAARAVRAVLFPPGAPEGTGGEGGAAGAGRAAQQPVMAPPDLSAALHQLSSLNEELQVCGGGSRRGGAGRRGREALSPWR